MRNIAHLFFRSGLVLAAAIAVGAALGCRKAASPGPQFAVPVVAAEVLVQSTTNYMEYIGQTRGAQDVEIRARVAGFLESVNFTEGTLVKSNAVLYTIDDRPFRASVAQAQGQLAQVEASWFKSKQDTNRLGPLWEKRAISRQQYDDALAGERAAAASVKVAQAALESAELQLGYTRISAPIEGLVGKTEVKPGNLVGQGATTLLTTLSSLDPIHVRFSVSEKVYLEWRRKHQEQTGNRNIFELILADGSVHPEHGQVVFADRQVDPATGTLLLEVAFPNPGRIVRPGQFARVRFPVEIMPEAVLIPQRAVQEYQAIYSVFVVGADGRAEFRRIALGPRVETFYLVREGLKPGDRVVVSGIQKLQNGVPMTVTVTNLAPEFTSGRVYTSL